MRSTAKVVGLAFSLSLLNGCGHSPSFNVLGSFFPGWIMAVLLGIVCALCARFLLVRLGWERRFAALPLLYFSITVLAASLVWLIAFD
ncbi:MAG: YtcA family lipoprotein [Terriglobia bacterium]